MSKYDTCTVNDNTTGRLQNYAVEITETLKLNMNCITNSPEEAEELMSLVQNIFLGGNLRC